VRAGRLDRQITIEAVTYTTADDGSQVESWATLTTCFAQRETQSAIERFAAAQTVAEVDTLWRIRWNNDLMQVLSPKLHRIVYRDQTYNILGLVEIGRKEGVHVPCKSRGDAGGTP
jgi:SPP1 family predicted phage head-tail adaptor